MRSLQNAEWRRGAKRGEVERSVKRGKNAGLTKRKFCHASRFTNHVALKVARTPDIPHTHTHEEEISRIFPRSANG